MYLDEMELKASHLIRDRDTKFGRPFDLLFNAIGVDVTTLPIRSPNLNAYAERFVQTLQVECLDHFVVFGRKHLDYLLSEFVDYYHHHRPHQGIGNRLILRQGGEVCSQGEIDCEEKLGGLLKHYYRKAVRTGC